MPEDSTIQHKAMLLDKKNNTEITYDRRVPTDEQQPNIGEANALLPEESCPLCEMRPSDSGI